MSSLGMRLYKLQYIYTQSHIQPLPSESHTSYNTCIFSLIPKPCTRVPLSLIPNLVPESHSALYPNLVPRVSLSVIPKSCAIQSSLIPKPCTRVPLSLIPNLVPESHSALYPNLVPRVPGWDEVCLDSNIYCHLMFF